MAQCLVIEFVVMNFKFCGSAPLNLLYGYCECKLNIGQKTTRKATINNKRLALQKQILQQHIAT
eukprot:5093947-Amphidinium_carterae.1